MEALDNHSNDDRLREDYLFAEAAKQGPTVHDRTNRAHLMDSQIQASQATADLATGAAREQRDMRDPMTIRSRAGLSNELAKQSAAVGDEIFNQSSDARRPAILNDRRAIGKLDTSMGLEAKRGELNLAMDHPLTQQQREDAINASNYKASMDALGRIYANPENFDAVGGQVPGLGGAPRPQTPGAQQPGAQQPGGAPPPAAGGDVPQEFASDIAGQFQERYGRPPSAEETATIYRNWQRRQNQPQ
jgi:hypothetical protein